jgi:hypothetical protein
MNFTNRVPTDPVEDYYIFTACHALYIFQMIYINKINRSCQPDRESVPQGDISRHRRKMNKARRSTTRLVARDHTRPTFASRTAVILAYKTNARRTGT